MYNKLIMISVLLLLCIAMMVSALVLDERTFGQISGYFSILCIIISLVGVLVFLRKNKIK